MMKPEDLYELPFLVFIYIADADNQVSVCEVEKFNQCIANTDWCESILIKEALALVGSKYTDLWKLYSDDSVSFENIFELIKMKVNQIEYLDSDFILMAKDLIKLGFKIAKSSNKLGFISAKKKTALNSLNLILTKNNSDNLHVEKKEINTKINDHNNCVSTDELWPLSKLNAKNPNFWDRGKIRLKCNKVINETHNVKTFFFICEDEPVFFSYKPGQFISIDLIINGNKIVRSYSISSSPSRSFAISITVKRVTNGLVSNWLHDNLKVGNVINANGPFGKFNCFDNSAERLLLISGGSGITPMMSILRWLCDTGSKADIIFLHNAQTPKDIIFYDELKLLSSQNSNVNLVLSVSNANDTDWNGQIGRISVDSLKKVAPDFNQRSIFVCGPIPYMDAVKNIVQSVGFNMNYYYSESFGGQVSDNKNKASVSITPVSTSPDIKDINVSRNNELTIKFIKQNTVINVNQDDSILESSENFEIDIPYSCRSGNCGTCKVLKLEGEVEMDDSNSILSDDELKEGFILACVAKAKTNLLIDF